MKQLFRIINNDDGRAPEVLALKMSEKHFSFAATNTAGDKLYSLAYCSVEEWDEATLEELVKTFPEIGYSYLLSLISCDFTQSLLMPYKEFTDENAALLLKSLFGVNENSNITTEAIPDWQLYNVQAIPKDVAGWVQNRFSNAAYVSQYAVSIKSADTANAGGSMLVDFRTDDFSLIVTNQSKFLLAQTYLYSTPEDVVYYLLKICEQFSLSKQDVQLQLSGLIDKQSALYKELYQYFINVQFREAGWNITGEEYPAHFFTSLNDLAKCAS